MSEAGRTPMLDGARAFAAEGRFLFPIVPNSKTPLLKDWEHAASDDPAQLDQWATQFPGCNWGCAPARSGLVVFDLDRKNGKDGVAELERLATELEFEIPDALTVTTPSGGFHLYMSGAASSSNGKLAPGIDVKSSGGYVIAPGSVIDGKAYAITNYLESWALPDAPKELLSLANGAKHVPLEALSNVALDTEGNLARAIAFLKERAPAIEGQGGDGWTYQTAAQILDLGCSPETALDLMGDWNERCVPPWSADELGAKIANARAYMQNEPGCKAIAPAAEIFSEFLKAQRGADEPISFSEMLARVVPPVQEIVPGLIEKGTVTFLSAPGGSHKSRVALQWGLSIDAAAPIFGRTVERARFAYVSYEDHADEVARRAQAIAKRLKLPADSSAQFWDLSGKDSPLAVVKESGECELRPFWHTLHGHLCAIPGHKFVALDSTYNALRFEGAAKINEGAVMAGIGLLQRLCDETDSTLLVLWHPSQAGQERGDASGWSVAWHNAPRARLSLSPVKGTEDAFELRVEKRNHGSKGKPLTLHWSEGALLPRAETATVEHEAQFQAAVVRVAIMAAEQGAPLTAQRHLAIWQLDEIERAIGRRPAQREVKEALSAAMPAGFLRYLKGSRHRSAGYYPADPERAAELARKAKHPEQQGAQQ